MIKHTQTIRRQIADELSVFDHFVKLALKELITDKKQPVSELMASRIVFLNSMLRQQTTYNKDDRTLIEVNVQNTCNK